MNIIKELTDIFREVFDSPQLLIDKNTTADDIEAWDSFSHVNLILFIEKRFSIKIPLGETQALRNVEAMAELIQSKLNI